MTGRLSPHWADEVAAEALGNKFVFTSDGSALIVGPRFVEAFLADGTIRDDAGTLRGPSVDEVLAAIKAHPEFGVCDFCSRGPVAWRFPARSYQASPTQASLADWYACAECRDLVRAGRRADLVHRCVRIFIEDHTPDAPPGFAKTVLERVHSDFWRNREGPGEAVPAEADGG